MKRTRPRRRSFGLRTPAYVAIGCTVLFLWVGPLWERARRVEALERPQEAVSAMRTLCRTEPGVRRLHALAAKATLERKLELAELARLTGCLGSLPPEDQSRHHLHQQGEGGRVDAVVGLGFQAIDPAIEALEFGTPRVRQRAALALAALSPQMSNNQKFRTRRRLTRERGAEADALRSTLGVREAARDDAPKKAPAPGVREASKETSVEVKEEGGKEGPRFELGGEGLKLKLDGVDAPPVLRAPKLRLAPEDRPPQGVLFRREASP